MRIGLYTRSMFMFKGGSERATSTLANYFVDTGHEVILYHGEKIRETPVYTIDPRIITSELSFQPTMFEKEKELFLKHNLDVLCVISINYDYFHLLKLLEGTNTPLIFSERTNPFFATKYFTTQKCREFCFQYADALHFLCHGFVKTISKDLQKKAFVIPNAPSWDDIEYTPNEIKDTSHTLLTMARLQEFPKQISLLIKAFRLLQPRYPDWKCIICGDGSDRQSYQKMIDFYGLQGSVILSGAINDVQRYYKNAGLFCLPSAFEGLPCAMVEAQCYGVPCVGFAQCTGVNEIIRHGENGLLADDFSPESLAGCLDRLMGDSVLRQRMRQRSLELALRYDKGSVLAQWRSLLEYVATKKGHTALDTALGLVFPTEANDLKPRTPLMAQQFRVSHRLAQEVAKLDSTGVVS